jgi:hypothetical protein
MLVLYMRGNPPTLNKITLSVIFLGSLSEHGILRFKVVDFPWPTDTEIF